MSSLLIFPSSVVWTLPFLEKQDLTDCQQNACNDPPSQRIWFITISTLLLLFAYTHAWLFTAVILFDKWAFFNRATSWLWKEIVLAFKYM